MKIAVCLFGFLLLASTVDAANDRPNILFILSDQHAANVLGCYGDAIVRTPNLDKLASEGFLFNNHYVAVPTCGASRYALITGMLPRNMEHTRNSAIATYLSKEPEKERPESFIHHLRRNGYYTVGIPKTLQVRWGRNHIRYNGAWSYQGNRIGLNTTQVVGYIQGVIAPAESGKDKFLNICGGKDLPCS